MLRLYDAKSAPDYFPELSDPDKRIKLAKMSYSDYCSTWSRSINRCCGSSSTSRRQLLRWRGPDARSLRVEMGSRALRVSSLLRCPMACSTSCPVRSMAGRRQGAAGRSTIQTATRPLRGCWFAGSIRGCARHHPGRSWQGASEVRSSRSANQTARLRLSSTVLHARNEGRKARDWSRNHLQQGRKLYNVRGKPASWLLEHDDSYMVPELSEEQKKALAYAVKGRWFIPTSRSRTGRHSRRPASAASARQPCTTLGLAYRGRGLAISSSRSRRMSRSSCT